MNVGVFLVKAVVFWQDVLLVVSLQTLPQLYVWYGVMLLGGGNVLYLFVKSRKLVFDDSTILVRQFTRSLGFEKNNNSYPNVLEPNIEQS